MDSDSVAGDVDSVHGGPSRLAPPVEQLLVDAVTQQQGWLRVYGKAGRALAHSGEAGSGAGPGEIMAAHILFLDPVGC